MCALFGWLDYKHIVPYKVLKRLTQNLANAAEERGTDAAGISYVKDGKVSIYKRPKPAHKIHFAAPDVSAIMGHTRFATQGDKKKNYNNHPFAGHADKEFAFAHNGVLYNDTSLRKNRNLPDTHIETDSYIGVQLIEQKGKLDFDSLRDMAEAVQGNFTFTVLDEDNNLYIVKGSNPMYLIHFEALGLYVYASTESIMKKALNKSILSNFSFTKVDCIEGDILCINKNGTISREEFEPMVYRSHFASWYDYEDTSYYNIHEEMLLAYCGCYGVDSADVEMLLEYGYTCDEIEEMLTDHSLLRETLDAIKCEDSDSLYEQIYGCAY